MWIFVVTAVWLMVLAAVDLKERRVPVWMVLAGGVFAVIMYFWPDRQGKAGGADLFWSVMPGAMMLAASIFTKQAGWADGAVLILFGSLTGFRVCVFSFLLSMLLILAVSLTLLVFRKVGKNTRLPYLPFLFAGYLVQAAIRNVG